MVTEKNTNLIDIYEVDDDSGRVSGPSSHASSGATPFGFGFDERDHLIVSEAFGGATDQSAVSSYELDDEELEPITPSAATTETAACWIVVTDDGRFTYTTNTGSGSISGYRISRNGELDPARRRRTHRSYRSQDRSTWRSAAAAVSSTRSTRATGRSAASEWEPMAASAPIGGASGLPRAERTGSRPARHT